MCVHKWELSSFYVYLIVSFLNINSNIKRMKSRNLLKLLSISTKLRINSHTYTYIREWKKIKDETKNRKKILQMEWVLHHYICVHIGTKHSQTHIYILMLSLMVIISLILYYPRNRNQNEWKKRQSKKRIRRSNRVESQRKKYTK